MKDFKEWRRRRELLEMARDAFEEARDPFTNSSLVEHDVTLDECDDLSEDIAESINLYLSMIHSE